MNLKTQLRELAAHSEKIVELASNWVGPSGSNSKRQRPESNWLRAGAMGTLIGGPAAGILSQPLAAKSAENKVIYRKRDAATDALRIGLLGTAGSLVGGSLARRSPLAPVAGLAGLAGGLVGGYKWAKSANDNRINEARLDRVKTGMAQAYLSGEMKKRNARTAMVADSHGPILSASRSELSARLRGVREFGSMGLARLNRLADVHFKRQAALTGDKTLLKKWKGTMARLEHKERSSALRNPVRSVAAGHSDALSRPLKYES